MALEQNKNILGLMAPCTMQYGRMKEMRVNVPKCDEGRRRTKMIRMPQHWTQKFRNFGQSDNVEIKGIGLGARAIHEYECYFEILD